MKDETIKTNCINRAKRDFKKHVRVHNFALYSLCTVIRKVFNFETIINNGKIDFEMGGCTYNAYLSRGYIVLEEADNTTIENVWTTESVEEFIDLVKDLREDN
ncbi:hypothetical protein [Brachyspira sp.]|uniref:hypothetical protein n=1 Tax=Brachyspira sp. TaxID=1977261 RepID=UPI003D7C6F24